MKHQHLRSCLLALCALVGLCLEGGSRLGATVLRTSCTAPLAAPIALPNGTVGQLYTATLEGEGGVAPYTLTLRAGTLPTGMTFNNGVFGGTPQQSANVTLTVETRDANDCTGAQEFTLLINCPPLTLPTTTLPGGTVGVAYASGAIAPTGGTAPYQFTVTGLPAGMTRTPSSGTSGANLTLGGTPTQTGNFTVQVTATDAYGCASGQQSYALAIAKATPVITWNTPAAIGVGVALSATQLNATVSPNIGGTLTYSPPAGTMFNAGTYTLTANFTPTDTTNYQSASKTVTLMVSNPCGIDVRPLAMPTATRGVQFVQTLSGSPIGSYTFSLAGGTLPPGVSLVNSLGIYSLRGTPTTAGMYTFTIKAKLNNSTCEGVRMYTVTVQ